MYIKHLRVWFLVPIKASVKVSDDNDADDDNETTVRLSLLVCVCVCLLIHYLGYVLHMFICACNAIILLILLLPILVIHAIVVTLRLKGMMKLEPFYGISVTS